MFGISVVIPEYWCQIYCTIRLCWCYLHECSVVDGHKIIQYFRVGPSHYIYIHTYIHTYIYIGKWCQKGVTRLSLYLANLPPPLHLGVGRNPDLPFDLNPNKDGKDKVSFETHKMRNLVWDDRDQPKHHGLTQKPGTLWLWLTVRHGSHGPNRNRWFTVLKNGLIFPWLC